MINQEAAERPAPKPKCAGIAALERCYKNGSRRTTQPGLKTKPQPALEILARGVQKPNPFLHTKIRNARSLFSAAGDRLRVIDLLNVTLNRSPIS